ncbi:MAG: glycosyltransferase family 39 protein [Thermoflexales bacterium]
MQKEPEPAMRRADRAAWLIDAALAVFSGAFVLVFFWVIAQRMAYPYGLEWLEGALFQQARRAAFGLPLYTAPGPDYTPMIYPPMFAWLGAPLVYFTPSGIFSLRVLSVAATLVTAALLFKLTRDETRSAFAGALSASLYLAMYRISGAWYDVARVDAVFVALMFAAVAAARRARNGWGWALAGVLFAAATLTKHPAAFVMAAIAGDALLRRNKAAVALPLAAGAILLGAFVALESSSGGWFSFYVLKLPAGDPWSAEIFMNAFVKDLLGPLPIAIAAALGFLVIRSMRGREWRMWAILLIVTALGSAWSRAHVGGSPNTLMPVFATLALLGGMAFGEARTSARGMSARAVEVVRIFASLGAIVQFACLVYTPGALVPTARDTAMNAALADRIARAGGEVFAPFDDTLAYLGARAQMASASSIENVDRNETPQAAAMRVSLDSVIGSKRYAMIIWDYPPWKSRALDGDYILVDVIPARAGQAPLGWHAGDRRVYVLR